MNEVFGKFCDARQCDTCIYREMKTVYECEYEWLAEHDTKVRAEVIEFISDKLIYPLLDECDRGLWEHIDHIELAEEWIKVLDDSPYPKVKNHIEARKRDLRRWIAEKLKEQKDGETD